MAGVVTTSIVVQFGTEGDAAYHLSAEIDSREDGYNGGETSFIGGDSPVFLVYKSDELSLSFVSSTGGVQNHASGTIEQQEWLIFADEKTKSLSKPPTGSVTLEHFAGTTGGTVVGSDVTLPAKGVAVYRATYDAKFLAYKMTNIPTTLKGESAFPVVIVVTGIAA
jgi:hypothetical protein